MLYTVGRVKMAKQVPNSIRITGTSHHMYLGVGLGKNILSTRARNPHELLYMVRLQVAAKMKEIATSDETMIFSKGMVVI